MENHPSNPIFTIEFTIPETAIDQLGHVNNVIYVQWMQDIAVRHYEYVSGTAPMQAAGAIWLVREHHIEYLQPAFAGEVIEVQTWVANIRRVRSLRKYRFVHKSDGQILVKGETDWVFVNLKSMRPIRIPDEVINVFTLLPDAN
jgi:acyl-CoA thioester hydrolase